MSKTTVKLQPSNHSTITTKTKDVDLKRNTDGKDFMYFYYERVEPLKYPEPRDIRLMLQKMMIKKYDGKPLSTIPLATEFVVKKIRNIEVLKYKVVNCDWEETRNQKEFDFHDKMFRWEKGEEPFHAIYNETF